MSGLADIATIVLGGERGHAAVLAVRSACCAFPIR